MKTREEIKKEFYERWDKTKEFGSGSTDNVYKDANKVWKWIEQELLSSPEKKEVCKEAFESGYGGKLSKKAEKEFENIYSKLEKKEENCAYIEFTDVDGSVYRTSAGNGLFDKDRVEKEEPTQEFTKEELKLIDYCCDLGIEYADYNGCMKIKEIQSKIERLLK